MPERPKQTRTARKGEKPAEADVLEFVVAAVGAGDESDQALSHFFGGLSVSPGLAIILVQGGGPALDEDLHGLAISAGLSVDLITDGMTVEVNHLYVAPPGTYVSVSAGALHLSKSSQPGGTRRPFDFLLHSLAQAYGPNGVCVLLSGAGEDGSAGLKSISGRGGLVIAQAPDDTADRAMPESAIATGEVDLIVPAAAIGAALVKYKMEMAETDAPQYEASASDFPEFLSSVVALIHDKTGRDYSGYKPGTLLRRVERRMTLASIPSGGFADYLDLLRRSGLELDQLTKDLLIHVTGFFRDPHIFANLAENIVPQLVKAQSSGQPIRIWSVGCSTGEEAYSLAMIFREALSEAGRQNKIQIFASDADATSIAAAREGVYTSAIEAEVSPERLNRFFVRVDGGYRVNADLRATLIFSVQDLLADPPFSKLDFVSCRNLLIYLGNPAQAKAISLFHFALRPNGILLLGNAENPGAIAGRFEVVSKVERLFRRVGSDRPSNFAFSPTTMEAPLPEQSHAALTQNVRPPAIAELCRRWAAESYAPALVLLDRTFACLFKFGSVAEFLSVPEGLATTDILAMVNVSLRSALRLALQRARAGENTAETSGHEPSVTTITHFDASGAEVATRLEVRAFSQDGEPFYLVGFITSAVLKRGDLTTDPAESSDRVRHLERELEEARTELEKLTHDFERVGQEQRVINEEAAAVNEEYQSTNEELLTSKEELQSLNEELTALNSQLQETLDRQRTTATDLQNVLYSTHVATLFLDTELNIRFFTPKTRALFKIIPGDVGRPLSDLHSLARDIDLDSDARQVLATLEPIDREILTSEGLWFLRRVMPYVTDQGGVDGVVITFTDITERKRIDSDLQAAKQEAELANIAKTRFLAAASHDLRQPLQSLALLQGLLAKAAGDEPTRALVARLDETIDTMSGMLNTLLDINQFESGMVRVNKVEVAVDDIFDRVKSEFSYHAQARGLTFNVMPCSIVVVTDPALLEQLIRNLLSNAIKYTHAGGICLGARRFEKCVRIEVLDTGIGIEAKNQEAIFEEYYQVDNAARQRSRGLGLGLSIVKRLAEILDHEVSVRSKPGKGATFSIEIRRAQAPAVRLSAPHASAVSNAVSLTNEAHGCILVIEDDPEVRSLVQVLLEGEGHRVIATTDGPAALDAVTRDGFRPDLIIADYNLPGGLTGVETASRINDIAKRHVPTIILTGDVSAATVREIGMSDCLQMNKPVKSRELLRRATNLLMGPASEKVDAVAVRTRQDVNFVYVVDDDANIRDLMKPTLEAAGFAVETYADGEGFLSGYQPGGRACALVDAGLPGMSGIDLLKTLRDAGHPLPVIIITGNGDVAMAVSAMKAGATDFFEKPIRDHDLVSAVKRVIEQSLDPGIHKAWQETAARQLDDLTLRQRQIMHMVLAGHPNKNIALDLGISQRTVENHRAAIMAKTGAKSLPALARLALAAVDKRGH